MPRSFCGASFTEPASAKPGHGVLRGTSAEPASAELRLRVQLRVLQALRLLCVQLRILQALHLLRVQLRVLQAACVLRFQLRVLQAIRVFRVQSAPFRRSAYSASSCASCRRSARTGAGECLSPDLTRTGGHYNIWVRVRSKSTGIRSLDIMCIFCPSNRWQPPLFNVANALGAVGASPR